MNFIKVAVIIALFARSMAVCAGKELIVTATNPSNLNRMSEIVSVPLDDIRKNLPSFDPATVEVVDGKSKRAVLLQLTDTELLFLTGFKPHESRFFTIRTAKGRNVQSLVDGRYVEPRQDYAWENDRIAFRMYGPALAKEVNNGIDVWCKRVRHLVVERWYKGDEDTGKARISYHIDHGEGADFFDVGRSLGAGGSALLIKNAVVQPGVFASYKTICNGPLRTSFELTYNWNVDGRKFTETKRITLDAGQNLNRIDVAFSGTLPDTVLQIACGLVKRKNVVSQSDTKRTWMSLWGPTNADTANGFLGTGVVMPGSLYAGVQQDSVQYLMVGKYRQGDTFSYYAGAGWTRSGDYATAEDWNAYLDACAQKIQSPLKVSISKK